MSKKLTFLAVALSVLAGSISTGMAQVQLPCGDECVVDPCKLAPERCTKQGGPIN